MTTTGIIFFASVMDKVHKWAASRTGSFQSFVFWGAFFVLALLVFGWAVMVRDQDRPHRPQHRRSRPEPAAKQAGQENKGGGFFSRFRRKRRRKKHRQANPTLAETGGLPNARDGGNPPPAPPAPPA